MDIPENKELSDAFNISSIPQNIFVDANGIEVDRIVGYLPPKEFNIQVNNILNGDNTISDIKNKLTYNPNNVELLFALGEKLEQMGEYSEAAKHYNNILKLNSDVRCNELASFNLAKIQLNDGNTKPLITHLNDYPDSENLSLGFKLLTKHFRKVENTDKEVELYNQWVSNFPNDSNVLNSYAWRMSELEINLENALELATKAVTLSAFDPMGQAMIIDTEAEILWKLGRIDEAVESIEKAIQIEPDDNYYQSQKEKFQNSKNIEPEV